MRCERLHWIVIVQIPSAALRPLVNLESLSLRHNRIRRIARRAFNASRALQTLDLSNNRIRKISKRSFHGLHSVRKIDLRHNRLVSLDQQTFTSLQEHIAAQVEVYASENPWLCNCIFGLFFHVAISLILTVLKLKLLEFPKNDDVSAVDLF